uniref:Uncharacterized protein LOC104247363 n=1 Tax=Nicotiana sylvestris TaxID=4096 RepID=A0A1U7YS49_NICSY|nr:PREDICTED: uncharacterized protein LOC104247363 [Nicotiana sylvestris]
MVQVHVWPQVVQLIHSHVCGILASGYSVCVKSELAEGPGVTGLFRFWTRHRGNTCRNLRTAHEWFHFSQKDTKSRVFLDYYGNRLHQFTLNFLRLGYGCHRINRPAASNGHRFILIAIDNFTKWVEAASYKAVTKKVVTDFVRDRIVCRFEAPDSIITDNTANLKSDLMKAMCETSKNKQRNSTSYIPQMNRLVEATNKNIKKILRKMEDNYKQWHVKLPFALLGYRTTVRASTGAIPTY